MRSSTPELPVKIEQNALEFRPNLICNFTRKTKTQMSTTVSNWHISNWRRTHARSAEGKFDRKFVCKLVCAALSLTILLAGHYASAKVEYDSNQLRMKNSEEFSRLVKRKIKLASNIQSHQKLDFQNGLVAEPDSIAFLTDGLRIVLSRPDQDEVVDDLYASIRHELADLNSFSDVIKSLVNEAVRGLKDDETPVREQGTYITILNNLMSETKPELRIGNELYKSLEMIRDAKIKISDKLKNEMFLHSMSTLASPSETAKIVLKDAKPDTRVDEKSNTKSGQKPVDKKANRGKKSAPDDDTDL